MFDKRLKSTKNNPMGGSLVFISMLGMFFTENPFDSMSLLA